MQRLVVHSTIILACYYICHVHLGDHGMWDIIFAIFWSGNAFWLPDYLNWFINVKK